VGRDQKLKDLHAQLQQNDRIAITAIAGMGGIGKTELALQYAITQLWQNQYPAGLCWLRARDQEIATQIVIFAQVHLGLTLPDKLEIEDQVRYCWQHWPAGDVLVVLDDVTDYKAVEPYLPPLDPRFKLLITTRLKLGRSVEEFSIEALDEDSAIKLLESLVKDGRVQSQLDDAKAVCQWVGYLPLALELLGRFLARKPDWTINRLLKAVDEKRLEAQALTVREAGMTGQLGVTAALELSWQELNEAEQELACVLGMFAIAPIPWLLVEQCLAEVESDVLEEVRDDGLVSRSLLKRVGEGTYQLHQIVQEYFRVKLNQRLDQGQKLKQSFCCAMVELSQRIKPTPTIDQIKSVRNAIAHLEEVINHWDDTLSDDDLIWPYLGVTRFYEGQGNYDLALPWSQACLAKCQQRLGPDHPYVTSSLNNLAALYRAQGRYSEAEPLYVRSLSIWEQQLGEVHPNVASSLNNLAALYRDQGRYSEAEPLLVRSLSIREQQLGPDHPDVAQSLNNLAGLYESQGRYSEAEPLYVRSLSIYEQQLGPDHPEQSTTALIVYHSVAKYFSA
jgi:tetratricopeptide (TPR) repeat protein